MISFIQSIPSASEFVFLISPVYFSLYIFLILVIIAFLPIWIAKMRLIELLPQKIQTYISLDAIVSFIGIVLIIWSIFEEATTTVLIVASGLMIFFLFSVFFSRLYKFILGYANRFR